MAKIMQEKTTEPRHLVEDIEARHGGDGFEHEQKKVARMYKQPEHKMHHEHVKAMCGGGMTKRK